MIIDFKGNGGQGGEDPRVDQLIKKVNAISGDVEILNEKVEDIELTKSPNATIVGNPVINQGQVSFFGVDRYLQFPFIVDLSKYNSQVDIDFSFTTNDDVTSQQNILDSQYGIAFAVRDSRFVVVASENGTSWTSGEVLSEAIVQPNTTYYIKLNCFRGEEVPYNIVCQYSLDKSTYTEFGSIGMNSAPYPRTIIIGKNYFDTNYFKGSINLNDASIATNIMGKLSYIWQGMDDVGLSTRASVTLDNIDADGEAKINEVMKLKTINGLSIKGEGNIDVSGGGSGSYLPLSGGTLNGNLTLGDTAETSYRKVESIRNTNSQANGAAFYVNSDGTAAFYHKSYNGTSASNDAILKFDANGIQFAKGGSRGTTATVFHDVVTDDSFKTINGESIIGEGDIEIKGGSYQYVNEIVDEGVVIIGDYNMESEEPNGSVVGVTREAIQIYGVGEESATDFTVSGEGASINGEPIVTQGNFSYDPNTKTLDINFI